MNKYVKIALLGLLGVVLLINTSALQTEHSIVPVEIGKTNSNITLPEIPCVPTPPPRKIGRITIDEFKHKMALLETGNLNNPYVVVNQYGYTGKYQFGRKTLRGLVRTGYLKATKKELRNFKTSPELQERAMEALVNHNIDVIKRYGLMKYIGKEVRGVTVTLEGMLAGAHLVGPYAVKHFIVNNGSLSSVKVKNVTVRKFDGNGVSVMDYMKQFEPV